MGKRTTTRHKEDNTFRFETFEEKLKNISVTVNLSIRDGRTDVPDEETTFFFQEVEKWVDLNRTESFGELLVKIGNDIKSLPQVLLQKDRLAQLFLDHLSNSDNQASFEPTFALIVALSRDLGSEFYPHFSKFFKTIIGIAISSKNPEIIEQGFKCYAYLSKYLRRHIVRDLSQHLKLFAPLLDPKLKKYVVIFACESFEVVASKFSRDHPEKFLDLIFKILLKNNPENSNGVGTLLFAMFKGVGGSIKLRGPGLKLEECINYLFKLTESDQPIWMETLKCLIKKLLNHANPKDTKFLYETVEKFLVDPERRNQTPIVFTLYQSMLEFENGEKIPDVNSCVSVLKILTSTALEFSLQDFTQTVITLIEMKGKSTNPEILSSLKSTVIKILEKVDSEWVKKIDFVLQDTSHYFHSYLTFLVQAYERIHCESTSDSITPLDNKTVKCISEAVIRQNGFYHMLKKDPVFFTGFSTPLWFYDNQRRLIRPLNMTNLSKNNFDCCEVISYVENSLESAYNLEKLARLFLSYSRMSTKGCFQCIERCRRIANIIIGHHEACEDVQKSAFSMILFLTLETILMHGQTDSPSNTLHDINIVKYLKSIQDVIVGAAGSESPFSLWSLKCLDLIVHYVKIGEADFCRDQVLDFVNETTEELTSNLKSGFKIVRSLTLSIIRNVVSMSESTDAKLVEMYDKFLEIENMSLMDPKFSPLVKSVQIESKVLMESSNSSLNVKKICLKYTLGLLYSNFNLIWPICVEVIQIAGRNLNFEEFWAIFGKHFMTHFPESSCGSPRLSVLDGDCEESEFNFLKELEVLAFGFPKSVSGNLGSEETLDLCQYRVNLWKSMSGLPIGKQQFGEIKYIIEKTITRSFDAQFTERGLSGEINKTLVSMFQFLEKCELAGADQNLWEKSLDHLISTPDVQQAVWEFLHAKRKKLKNFKADVDELIKSDSMDCAHKFRIDAIDTTLNKQYNNESPEKRGLLMDVVIRILIGKEKRWKAEKRLQVLRFIGGCTVSDAKKYLEFTVGPALKDERISPKAIEVKINKISNCIRAWRYKFPTILDELLNLVCDLTVAIENLKKPFPKHSEEEELPDSVFEEQKKGALKAGRLCIVAFFTFLSKFNLEDQTIERIFNVFIWTGIEELRVHTGSNISWIMKLFAVWSSHERFHPLLAKCCDGEVSKSAMQGVFDLLGNDKAQFDVRKHLLGILLNLAEPSGIEEKLEDDDQQPLEYSEKFDGRLVTCKDVYSFDTQENLGLNIVLFGKHIILNIFQDVQLFKRFVNEPGGERCLALISKLAEFVDEGEATQKLCSILIEIFPMYKMNEESLFHCLVACKNLMGKVTDSKPLALKLANAFTWVSGRRLRTALCEILSTQKDRFLYETIRNLNAWTDLATDTPDFQKRQEAFQALEKAITEGPFHQVLFTLTATNCFNGLLHESDIGMRNSAKNLLVIMSEALKVKSFNEVEKKQLHQFLESIILARLRGGIQHKDENRFADYLHVYISFITNGTELHGTFKELNKILTLEIIEGLQDLQIHLRTRAMNKLAKKLEEVGKEISPTVLKNFVLPLANHNLLDEEKLGKNSNELIDASIVVMKTILLLMPHEHYFKHLITLVDNSKKKTKLAKQYERILVAAMDAFHFDLSLVASTNFYNQNKIQAEPAVQNVAMENVEEENKVEVDNTKVTYEDMSAESDEETEEAVVAPLELETKITLVPKSAATKCLKMLKSVIIPKLRQYLNFEEKATHKLSRAAKTVDDDVILKIPCTIALVKLLKKLPKSEGENSIRSIIPSLCAGLRNELLSVRNTLRRTLLNVIKELGTSHFKSVIGYLKSTLQRGYQKHVLNYTVGYLMKCLESELKKNPEHLPIKEVLPLCEDELYGVMQEEKDLAKIKAKTREASKSNAHPILKLCSKCIQSKNNLRILVEPAVKHLTIKRNPKVIKATRLWLKSVGEGLADNIVIDHVELIDWLREVMDKESLDHSTFNGKNSSGEPEAKKKKLLVETKDAFLIATTVKKATADGKITGQFLLTEFAFNCLYNGLNKNSELKTTLVEREAVQVLDVFVKKLGEGIQSPSKQVNIVSLRCLTLLLEYELKSFKDEELIDGLRRSGFIAMNNHCYRTTSDSEMTNATFKFLTGFFLRFPEYKIAVQDFELMLKCIQSYLTNGECSSAAITLLKGVLRNKFKSKNLAELMEEVFKQSIQSFYQHINEGCRQAYFIYLNNYCTSTKELSAQVQLILNQFDYPIENGRLTSVEIMNSLLDSMPQKNLEEIKELVFFKTIATLDKELQPKVREKLCEVTKTLFQNEGNKTLVRLLLKLMNLKKHISELDTFFLVAGGLVGNPKIFTEEDFIKLLNKIEEVLNPLKFEELCDLAGNISQQAQDYAIYQAIICLRKGIMRQIGGSHLWSSDNPHSDIMKEIFNHLRETHLQFEHEWVPVVTLDLFTIVFEKLNLGKDEVKDGIAKSIEGGSSLNNTIITCADDLKIYLKNIWTMIKFSDREDVLMKGAVILVQLASTAAILSDLSIFIEIISEIKRSVNHEVVKDPKNTTIRSIAFASFRGIVKNSPVESIREVAEGMTRVAVRELTDEGVPAELKSEAEKLTTSLRIILGNAEFNALYATVNDFYHKKRNLNRAKKKETFVINPGKIRKRPKKTPMDPSIPFKKQKS